MAHPLGSPYTRDQLALRTYPANDLGVRADGEYLFTTIKPGAGHEHPQAPHVSVCLFARGLLRHVYTRIYFAGDHRLASDPILELVPAARRSTLVAEPAGPSSWQHVIRLQGPGETVFFDV